MLSSQESVNDNHLKKEGAVDRKLNDFNNKDSMPLGNRNLGLLLYMSQLLSKYHVYVLIGRVKLLFSSLCSAP